MSVNFPNSPILYQIFNTDDNSFIWNGKQWVGYSTSLTVNYNASSVVIQDDNSIVGATTSINFGSNLDVSFDAGVATIDATGGGGGGESYWAETSVGIHTLSNVGIGTDTATETLTVDGDARVTGILTVGTASITLNGITDIINVGSGVTIDGSTGIIEANSIVIGGIAFTGISSSNTIVTISDTAPESPSEGNLWYNSTISRGFIYYVDEDSSQWVDFSPSGGGGVGGGESYWEETSVGIHTLSNVGIGTTNPTSKLHVIGDAIIVGTTTVTSLVESSSITLKENISPIENALDKILQLNPVTYDRKNNISKNEAGLIAEEVEKIIPNIVSKDDEGNPEGISYTKLTVYLIDAMKTLTKELRELKNGNP